MDLVTPDIGLMFWTLVSFLTVLVLLRIFAWKPILESVDNRNKNIEQALRSAEEAKREMQNLKADNEELVKQAREERDAMMKEARELKEKMISEASEQAQQKADKIVANAQTIIQKEKQDAVAEIKEQVAGLSLEIAEKVIRKELGDKKDQMKLVDNMLDEVSVN